MKEKQRNVLTFDIVPTEYNIDLICLYQRHLYCMGGEPYFLILPVSMDNLICGELIDKARKQT